MRFCNIITLAVGVAYGINPRLMVTDFDVPEAENHCFSRCMISEKECREIPGANLSRCTSDFANCKRSCSWKMATGNSTLTSTSTSTA